MITAIVPRLPPAVDGLGDYGIHLARQLRQDYQLNTRFLIGDPNWVGESTLEGHRVESVARRSAQELTDRLASASIVLLHYVGYGYAQRGCPVWLVEGLERWKASTGRCLITMFHEVYATGPMWTSAFWTSSLQKKLAARLTCLSDHCLTSISGYAERIRQLSSKQTHIPSLPVFSTIGEPTAIAPLADRTSQIVIFGSRGPRSRVYQQSRSTLEQTCRLLKIEEILDIGPALDFQVKPISQTKISFLGVRPAPEISGLLSSSTVGFLDYPTEFLGKSTIFAAYCAHGLLTIAAGEGRDVDGLQVDQHYWRADPLKETINLNAAQAIADQAHCWYQNHCLRVQAHHFAAYLKCK